jgi:hypothetical protein
MLVVPLGSVSQSNPGLMALNPPALRRGNMRLSLARGTGTLPWLDLEVAGNMQLIFLCVTAAGR